MDRWLLRASVTGAVLVGAYGLLIALLTFPTIQRNALYAHRVNPVYYEDLSNVDQYGFHGHQVQPFTLTTTDNATIHAWHILPTHLYLEHESDLLLQPDFGLKSSHQTIFATSSFNLLLSDANSRVVLSFHGNAAHLASSLRPATYQHILGLSTQTRPVHVIAFDYRGFGLSTGSPTEAGIIEDALTVLSFLTGSSSSSGPPRILPSQIILLGQSLGTAVSTALYHHWSLAMEQSPLHSLILLASFSSVPSLMESYSIKGLVSPLLFPPKYLASSFKTKVFSFIVDTWQTSQRLQDLVRSVDTDLDLTIMHARDDWEIPWQEGRKNFDAMAPFMDGFAGSKADVIEWESSDHRKRVRWELIKHGGHNRVAVGEQMKAAILRSLNRAR